MTERRIAGILASLALLAGCSDRLTGNDQTILIGSTPTGSSCRVTRSGEILATIARTPMTVAVPMGTDPLSVTCAHPGLAAATVEVGSRTGPGTIGSRLPGGSAGRALDAALLADFRYPGTIMVAIERPPPGPLALPLAHR